jgi:phage gpG-like protein
MSGEQLTIQGTEFARAEMERIATDLAGDRFVRELRTVSLMVVRSARTYAPVDTGRLKNSITAAINVSGNTVNGVVGSNVVYAPYMETGTKPHFPPPGKLRTWARRHGTNEYVIAKAIARSGLKGRGYLKRAFEDNRDTIKSRLGSAVTKIVRK